jgi:hypothetical protein
LKIGTIFPVYKNKGDIKNAKNYRGITVTPTFSKIIEKIFKIREDLKIIDTRNPLQKSFTEKSVPLLCDFFIEEFERESKDLDLPTYIGFLDDKSTFDVVVHANLIPAPIKLCEVFSMTGISFPSSFQYPSFISKVLVFVVVLLAIQHFS